MLFRSGMAQGLENWSNLASKGVTEIKSTFGKTQVLIKITNHEFEIGKPSDQRPKQILSSCTYARFPCSPVDYLEIFVNGQPLFVARSVYADLADVNKAKLQRKKGQFILTLDGGDASESFTLALFFDEQLIKKRILKSNEANQVLQETTYSAPKAMDD